MKTEGAWAYAGHARSITPKNQDNILIGDLPWWIAVPTHTAPESDPFIDKNGGGPGVRLRK
jgi:hypothetical protein